MQVMIKKELIEEYLKRENISKTEFCKRSRISPEVYNKIMSDKENYRIDALFRVAKTLGVRILELFND